MEDDVPGRSFRPSPPRVRWIAPFQAVRFTSLNCTGPHREPPVRIGSIPIRCHHRTVIINPPTNDDLELGESQSEVHIKYDKERQGYITRSDQKGLLSKLTPAYSRLRAYASASHGFKIFYVL